jgi:hypothetical protein
MIGGAESEVNLATDGVGPDYYTNLVHVRNVIHDDITNALEIVKRFITDNDLILVGGMAIDLALKLKGDGIYTDEQLPDYDFYSPVHTEHAYMLGAMLCKQGFPNISCIQAGHITTMRVRVDYETVADITYCPPSIYKTIPTLKYGKMRIVHPHFQMIDQHTSLSFPFTQSGPTLVIFHRWKKDMVRYDKLYSHYPVVPEDLSVNTASLGVTLDTETPMAPKYTTAMGGDASNSAPYRGYIRSNAREKMAKSMEIPLRKIKIGLEHVSGGCLSGWAAIDYELVGDDHINLFIPEGQPVTVASDDYKSFIEEHKLTDVEYYSEYFGKLPRRVMCSSSAVKKMEILDTYGTKLSAKKISDKHNVYVCNIQWAMLYMMVRIVNDPSPKIRFTAEEQYIRCRRLVMDGEVPSIDVYGGHNFSHSFLNRRKKDKERIYNIKAPQIQPANMFPKQPACANDKTFDPETSEYFKIDNRKLDSLVPWTIDPYPEYGITKTKGGGSGGNHMITVFLLGTGSPRD